MRHAVVSAILLLSALGGRAGVARAASDEPSVQWRDEWTPFSRLELAVTVGLTMTNYRLVAASGTRHGADWTAGVLFDDAVRDLLRARTEDGQDIAVRYSDVGFRVLAFFPYLVDAGIVALGVHRNPEVALQLALIDTGALTLAGFSQLAVAALLGRRRPYVNDCVAGRSGIYGCGSAQDNRSFYSGHAAAAFTSAGLTCVHHEYIPLYGGGPVERWACYWTLGLAATTSVLRVVSDNHYATDVLVGAAMGGLYGYLLPKWLHYENDPRPAAGARRGERGGHFGVLPLGPDPLGLTFHGTF